MLNAQNPLSNLVIQLEMMKDLDGMYVSQWPWTWAPEELKDGFTTFYSDQSGKVLRT